MSTRIPYLDEVWNITTGCGDEQVSPGCLNCYARRMFGRHLWREECPECRGLANAGYDCPECRGKGTVPQTFTPTFHADRLDQPLHWRKPRRIGVSFMGDLFHEAITDEQLDKVFQRMVDVSRHTYLLLTKRPAEMRRYAIHWCGLTGEQPWGDNVMLGVTVCTQQEADEKIPILLATPAAKRWVSIEPMLGPVDLTAINAGQHAHAPREDALGGVIVYPTDDQQYSEQGYPTPKLDWVILGGDTGPGARPMQPEWALDVFRQCKAAGVPFYWKQEGDWLHRNWRDAGDFGDGEEFYQMLGTHEFPEGGGV
jgi:protein gp37